MFKYSDAPFFFTFPFLQGVPSEGPLLAVIRPPTLFSPHYKKELNTNTWKVLAPLLHSSASQGGIFQDLKILVACWNDFILF